MSKSKSSRDEFSPTTIELLAKRAGYICSHPDCRRMTVAVSEDRKSGVTMLGVAAHITAAAQGGPRYDKDMDSAERASVTNGIWACQNHAKLIDDNASKYTVIELRRWKKQHEEWVFYRVESGKELFDKGVTRLSLNNVGVFSGSHTFSIGRNNILVGANESGKTTFCQILSAFTGKDHWKEFNHRFKFAQLADSNSFIEVTHQTDDNTKKIRLSPQRLMTGKSKAINQLQRLHIELDNCPSANWPNSLFRVLFFSEQLYSYYGPYKDTFKNALRYLAGVFNMEEDLIWDSLREELFVSSTFDYKLRRTGKRQVEIKVPDGRKFFLDHKSLSFTELQMAFIEVALKLAACHSQYENWIYIFDTSFFERLDQGNKSNIFKKMTNLDYKNIQTLFCLNSIDDAEILKDINSDKWVNAEHFGNMTLHSFL